MGDQPLVTLFPDLTTPPGGWTAGQQPFSFPNPHVVPNAVVDDFRTQTHLLLRGDDSIWSRFVDRLMVVVPGSQTSRTSCNMAVTGRHRTGNVNTAEPPGACK